MARAPFTEVRLEKYSRNVRAKSERWKSRNERCDGVTEQSTDGLTAARREERDVTLSENDGLILMSEQ